MADLDKQLKKFSPKELIEVERLIKKIVKKEFSGLNLKKLKGLVGLFRIRKGRVRIIFELKNGEEPKILVMERRKEDAYK